MNVTSNLEAVRAINEKNSHVLKEIADLLSKLVSRLYLIQANSLSMCPSVWQRCCDLSYEEIYTEKSSGNPFCIAIMEMYEKINQLENNKETEDLQSFVSYAYIDW